MIDPFDRIRDFWDGHAQRDPLWAILSDSSKSAGRWDVGRFFQTGVSEIAALFYQLDSRRVAIERGSALDFGCGVGRLTQALAPYFARVVGVDVSPRMLELATELNRFGSKVTYVRNEAADLSRFDDEAFDFIVSNIVLQHLHPDLSRAYIAEFFRVLAPGGVLVFQLPSHQRLGEDLPPAPSVRAMPDDAYLAGLAVTGVSSMALGPGGDITLDVAVTNRSAFEWSAQEFGVIRVGNHWRDASGDRMLIRDDGRSSLPNMLPSGSTCRVPLPIRAPADPGEYVCEIDLAHEGVLWFHDKGSPVVRFAVRVGMPDSPAAVIQTEASAPPASAIPERDAVRESPWQAPILEGLSTTSDDPGAFPMHGIPQDVVVEFIASHGGTLLHIESDHSCGDEWVSFRYYVTK